MKHMNQTHKLGRNEDNSSPLPFWNPNTSLRAFEMAPLYLIALQKKNNAQSDQGEGITRLRSRMEKTHQARLSSTLSCPQSNRHTKVGQGGGGEGGDLSWILRIFHP